MQGYKLTETLRFHTSIIPVVLDFYVDYINITVVLFVLIVEGGLLKFFFFFSFFLHTIIFFICVNILQIVFCCP